MRIRKTKEKDRVVQTLLRVKSAPFSLHAKKLVGKTLPSTAAKEIDAIYRDSSEEKKKKKAEEQQKLLY